MGKAERRHHRRRMLNKAYSINYYDKEWALMNYDHMCNCSCPMCCNERSNKWLKRRDKLSMQERKAEDSYNDQLK